MKNNQLFLLRSAQNDDIVIAAKKTFQEINEFLFLNGDKNDYYTLNINKNDYTFTTYKEFYELFKNKTHFDILENDKKILDTVLNINKDKIIQLFSLANKYPNNVQQYIKDIYMELKLTPTNTKNMSQLFNEISELFYKNDNGKIMLNKPTEKYYKNCIYNYCFDFINENLSQKENEDLEL